MSQLLEIHHRIHEVGGPMLLTLRYARARANPKAVAVRSSPHTLSSTLDRSFLILSGLKPSQTIRQCHKHRSCKPRIQRPFLSVAGTLLEVFFSLATKNPSWKLVEGGTVMGRLRGLWNSILPPSVLKSKMNPRMIMVLS